MAAADAGSAVRLAVIDDEAKATNRQLHFAGQAQGVVEGRPSGRIRSTLKTFAKKKAPFTPPLTQKLPPLPSLQGCLHRSAAYEEGREDSWWKSSHGGCDCS